jgi:hypothetical protein
MNRHIYDNRGSYGLAAGMGIGAYDAIQAFQQPRKQRAMRGMS